MTAIRSVPSCHQSDVLLLGGGLANGLLAWWLALDRPDLNVIVLEEQDRLGGDHTWCFHHGDVSLRAHARLKSSLVGRWESQRVLFPTVRREVGSAYYSIRSDSFDRVLRPILADKVHFEKTVSQVLPSGVICSDGSCYTAPLVLDGRGWKKPADVRLGYQTFVGLDIRFREPHGMVSPILMDARGEQVDGYRFFYCLPWDERTVLIEDTRYVDRPEHDFESSCADIVRYARELGGPIEEVCRTEKGCLPIPLDAAPLDEVDLSSGMRAQLFHPTTGYSLPSAVAFAEWAAVHLEADRHRMHHKILKYQRAQIARGRFYRHLNRMMFLAAEPAERYRLFERFYRMPGPLIERFYAGRNTWWDRVRILSGKPPVSPRKALRSLIQKREVSYA